MVALTTKCTKSGEAVFTFGRGGFGRVFRSAAATLHRRFRASLFQQVGRFVRPSRAPGSPAAQILSVFGALFECTDSSSAMDWIRWIARSEISSDDGHASAPAEFAAAECTCAGLPADPGSARGVRQKRPIHGLCRTLQFVSRPGVRGVSSSRKSRRYAVLRRRKGKGTHCRFAGRSGVFACPRIGHSNGPVRVIFRGGSERVFASERVYGWHGFLWVGI